MDTPILAVANQKGGCGKTTVSMQLAGVFGDRGLSCLVIDADPQGTATRWYASAPDDHPFPAVVVGGASYGATVGREAKRLAAGHELVIVDCPPAVESPATQAAIVAANAVLIPVVPSPPDLWAAVGIRQLVQALGKDDVARLVVNMEPAGTALAQEVAELLSDFGLPLLESHLRLRNAFRQAAVFGTHVGGLKPRDSKAVDEVVALADEVAGWVGIRTNGLHG